MKVGEVMTREVVRVRGDSSASDAAGLMWDRDCGALPVVDKEDRVIGMITDRDICMAAFTRGLALKDMRVDGVMSKRVFTCNPEDSISVLAELLSHQQIHRVPVVDSEGELVGIVSLNDLAQSYLQTEKSRKKDKVEARQVAGTLAAICNHGVRNAVDSLVAAAS
jgi:predicted transcriptional regulator